MEETCLIEARDNRGSIFDFPTNKKRSFPGAFILTFCNKRVKATGQHLTQTHALMRAHMPMVQMVEGFYPGSL